MYKVSVIIPVYNVANYIEKCSRSLFEQTLQDIEFIFIDDQSPDNSIDIVKNVIIEYPSRQSHTKFITMPSNTGLAGVRRHGILNAQGKYIIQCDSDDFVDEDYYFNLYHCAEKFNSDIVIGDMINEYKDFSQKVVLDDIPSEGKTLLKNWYKNCIGLFTPNKLVKKSLLLNNNILPWEGLNMWEDNGLFARLFYYAKNVSQVHDTYYHYNRTNVNAMTAGYGIAQVNQMIGIAKNLTDFFQSQSDREDFQNTVFAFQFLAKLNLITDSYKKYKEYKYLFPESNKIIPLLDNNAFSKKGLFRFKMVKYHLAPIFILMFKMKNLIQKI